MLGGRSFPILQIKYVADGGSETFTSHQSAGPTECHRGGQCTKAPIPLGTSRRVIVICHSPSERWTSSILAATPKKKKKKKWNRRLEPGRIFLHPSPTLTLDYIRRIAVAIRFASRRNNRSVPHVSHRFHTCASVTQNQFLRGVRFPSHARGDVADTID